MIWTHCIIISAHWVSSPFGLVFCWVWRLSGKLNLNANFWTESKVRLAQRKLLLKIDCLFTLFFLMPFCCHLHWLEDIPCTDCIPSLADELWPRTNGPRAQYLRPSRSQFVFSKRELTFTFAICYHPSVCRLSSVMLVHPTQAVQIFSNISTAFGTLAIRWHPRKILRRSSQGNPYARGVKRERGSQI